MCQKSLDHVGFGQSGPERSPPGGRIHQNPLVVVHGAMPVHFGRVGEETATGRGRSYQFWYPQVDLLAKLTIEL